MLALRWGPWLRTALALAVGVAAGALLPGALLRATATALRTTIPWAALLLATSALPGLRQAVPGVAFGRWRRRGPAAATLLVQGLVLWTGLETGRRARLAALRGCVSSLSSGDSVTVSGLPVGWGRYRTRRGAPLARLRLGGVQLSGRRGGCRVDRLLVILTHPPDRRPRRPVTLTGRWWRYPGPPGRPRLAGRHGLVRAAAPPRPRSAAEGGLTGRPGILAGLRIRAARRLERRLPPDVAPLGPALLLAERDGLPPALRDRFAAAGLAHVLAVSGLHVGALGAMILGLAGLVLPGNRRRYPLAAGLVTLYVIWIGAPPSAARAALIFAGWALTRYRGSPVSVLELVGAAAVVALLDEPLVLLDAGFQLSFAGFVGLLVGGRAGELVARRAGKAWKPAALVAAAAGAFLATAPLVAAHFGRVAPVAMVAGLGGAPLVGAALPALAAAASLPAPPGAWAADVGAGLLRLLSAGAGWLSGLPGAHGAAAPPGPAGWTAVLLGAAAVVRFAASGRPARAALPAAAAVSVLLAWPAAARFVAGDGPRVCVLDVGQGDAVTVRTGQGHWLLVDGGSGPPAADAGLEKVVPHLRRAGATGLEVVVLTHPHLDHAGGLRSVLGAFPVREVWDGASRSGSRAYGELLAQVARRDVRWRAVRAGDRFRLDDVSGRVLGPGPAATGPDRRDPNESSVVLRLVFDGGFTVLLAGDAGPGEESWMLVRWPPEALRSHLLKVSHHGSRSSTSRAWLSAVRPATAAISVGEANRYGHPHPALLWRLREAGVETVFRTDRDGTVCVEADRRPARGARHPSD